MVIFLSFRVSAFYDTSISNKKALVNDFIKIIQNNFHLPDEQNYIPFQHQLFKKIICAK